VARVAVVWWPDWPVVAAGAQPGRPAAVVHANRVVAATPVARADGVVPGARRRESQARCPGLEVVVHDPDRDARAWEPVLQALGGVTPLVEASRPGVVTFATRGPSRYHGGDEALAVHVVGVVTAALPGRALVAGPAGVGVADGRFAATLAARRAAQAAHPVLVVPPGGSGAFLAGLPVAVLAGPEGPAADPVHGGRGRLAAPSLAGELVDLAGLLPRLGLLTLGHLARLPAADVAARFGPVGAFAHQLAGGQDPRPPDARRPPPELASQEVFEPPVPTVGPLAFVARTLADVLHGRLAELGCACTRLVVTAETEHGERSERVWVHETAFSAAAMVERTRWQLEGWAQAGVGAPTGGITLLRLAPEEVVPAGGRQLGFWGGFSGNDERAARVAARLTGLLGPEAVGVPEWRGGRHPGESVAVVPAAVVELGEPEARRVRPPAGAGPWPGRLPAPSPATVLAQPEPIEVVDAGSVPVGVSGRGLVSAAPAVVVRAGRRHEVAAWAGPWPVEERWWDPARARRRARFQLLTTGGVALLASVEGGRWWLEAVYD
jgi:protein ImuB